jgi:hypothetical protein
MPDNDPWKHRSAHMRCLTCMWYVAKEKEGDGPRTESELGRCRRHAPTMSGYPVVFSTDWCGDHKLNENAM